MKWFINGGHGPRNDGGFDPGAVGPTGTKESEVANLFSWIVKYYLAQQGEAVFDPYQDGDLADITAKANASGADYFLSCHLNSGDSSAHGYEVYALSAGGKGEQLAKCIDDAMTPSGLTNRGVKFANFYVLRNTKMPAVLLELCFISNSAEEALVKNRDWLEARAKEVVKGCLKMVGKTWQEPQPAPAQLATPAPVVDQEKEALKAENTQLKAKLAQIKTIVG